MKDSLSTQQCREIIADLADFLPGALKPQVEDVLSGSFGMDADPGRREKWDPVFTGGATVGLLITDPAAPAPSRTKDIDIVLEIASYAEFAGMEDALRKAGFTQNWLENAPVVAWDWRGFRVDFLPHRSMEMMQSNRWFPYLMDEAEQVEVLAGRFAWCASAPCFLATKFEAFFSRGKGDYLMSKDIEDILAVIDGREELGEELSYAANDVRGFVSQSCRTLMADRRFTECLPQIVPDDQREEVVSKRLQRMGAMR